MSSLKLTAKIGLSKNFVVTSTVINIFIILYIITLLMNRTTVVSSCYIRMSVGLFTTEIYANWVRKEELERWV